MKNIYDITLFIILYVILFFSLLGCPPDPPIDPPGIDLIALVIDTNVEVSWDTVEDLSSFTVYRKEGTGDFVEQETIGDPETSYTDSTCPMDVELCYKIKFTLHNNSSFDSNESNSVIVESILDDYMTDNITASNLEYNDRIRIYWDAVSGTDSYKVYRYTTSGLTNPNIFDATTNQYDDVSGSGNGPATDTPYFYKVACVVDDVVYIESNDYSTGIFHDPVDYFENNDTMENGVELSTQEVTAYIYSFQNGNAQDVDWYKSTSTGFERDISITITLPAESSLSGEIQLVIQNTGVPYVLIEGENYMGYTGEDTLNFKVEFIYINPDINVLESYNIKMDIF